MISKLRWLLLALVVAVLFYVGWPRHRVERPGGESVCTGDCKADASCYDACHKRGWCEFSTEQVQEQP